MLREIYLLHADNFDEYCLLLEWMGECPPIKTHKLIADKYHEHMQKAGRQHKEHHLLPSIATGDRQYSEPAWPIAIYLDHVRSAHNVGSIIRTVEAFSLGELHLSSNTPAPSNKQVADASMGAHHWITIHQEEGIDKLPRPVIVMETGVEAIPITEFVFPETFTLVVGNEEYGCSDHILSQADYIVKIPLRGRKNSLNVANAFAIAAAEISRQRGMK